MDLAQFASSFGTSSVASKLMPWCLSSSTAGAFLERTPLAFSISGLMRPFAPPLPLGPHSEQEHPISPDSKSFRSSVDSVGISLILAMRSASAAFWASLSSFLSCLAALAATKLRAAAWRFLFGLGVAYYIQYISREHFQTLSGNL